MLETAIKLATEAHKGQVDKGGHDYIGHPLRVMNSVTHETDKIVAVLHDVVEDTPVSLSALQIVFNSEIIDAIHYMTRSESATWKSYIEGVMSNKIATRVKIADLKDNLDLTRLRSMKDIDINSLNMYLSTYHKLIKHERENR